MTPRIPRTDSIQELATFWQHNDLTDFEDELEEVTDRVFRRARVIGVPLSETEHRAVRDEAASRGIDEGALIHEWVAEKLNHR
jgi:predicted DNA binding CopG/RHH family protein